MTDSASENTSFPLDIEQSEKYDFENLIKDFLDFWRFLVIGKFIKYSRVFKHRTLNVESIDIVHLYINNFNSFEKEKNVSNQVRRDSLFNSFIIIFIESRFQSFDAYELHHILDNNFKFEQTNKNKGRPCFD